MNFGALKARAAFLAMQNKWDKAAPQPDWAALVQRGLVDWATDTEYNEEESTFPTVANQASYTLSTPYWITIKEVIYNSNTPLDKSSAQQEWSVDPLWTQRTATTAPSRFIVTSPNVIRLVDKPSAGSIDVYIRGTRVPAALSADTDSPLFLDTWHEAIALRAAVLHCRPWVTGEEDVARIERYSAQYKGMVLECKVSLSGERYGQLERRVRRPARRRVSTTNFGRNYY